MEFENPSAEEIESIKKENGITEESLKRDVTYLKEWMRKKQNLPSVTDERIFERYLYVYPNSMEKTKQRLEKHFTHRLTDAEIFFDKDPEDPLFKDLGKVAYYNILPKLSNKFERIIIFKLFDHDPSKLNSSLCVKQVCMLFEVMTREDFSLNCILIYDLKGFTMRHTATLPISLIHKCIDLGMSGLPVRFSAVHIINLSPLIYSYANFVINLIKEKLKKRVHIHSKSEDILKYVEQECLPIEYGGTLEKTMEELRDTTYGILLRNKKTFIDDDKFLKEESKKIIKDNSTNGVMDGSFRQLSID